MMISRRCLENVLFLSGSLLTCTLILISSTVRAHYSSASATTDAGPSLAVAAEPSSCESATSGPQRPEPGFCLDPARLESLMNPSESLCFITLQIPRQEPALDLAGILSNPQAPVASLPLNSMALDAETLTTAGNDCEVPEQVELAALAPKEEDEQDLSALLAVLDQAVPSQEPNRCEIEDDAPPMTPVAAEFPETTTPPRLIAASDLDSSCCQ